MKKILLASTFLLVLAGCGTKQLDNINLTGDSTNGNTATGGEIDVNNAFDGADVKQFATGSKVVVTEDGGITSSGKVSGQVITDMKPSRVSDEGCVWKKYSKFGITFLGEQCDLDGRTLEIVTLDDKKIFAIKQDSYDIDPANLEDTLGIQVFDTNGSSIADTIKKAAGMTCDITKVTNKSIGSFVLYTVKDSSETGDGTCKGYADLNSDSSKIFLINLSNPNKVIFMNTTNQQNLIDLNNFRID